MSSVAAAAPACRATVDELRNTLIRYREANEGFALMEILNSGSVAKKTAITPLNDIDLAVLLRPEQAPDHRATDLLERVRGLLIQAYHPKEPGDYTLGRHAVRIYFRGIDLSVDVVPLIPEPEKEGFALLPTLGSDEWVSTSIPSHVDFIREHSGKHPVFLELVRLVKWWRSWSEVHFKSFLIELLAAHLLGKKIIPADDLHEACGWRTRCTVSRAHSPTARPKPATCWCSTTPRTNVRMRGSG